MKAELSEIIAHILGFSPRDLPPQAHLMHDLGADSLAMFQVRAALETRFRLVIPDDDVTQLYRLEAIETYIRHRLDSRRDYA